MSLLWQMAEFVILVSAYYAAFRLLWCRPVNVGGEVRD